MYSLLFLSLALFASSAVGQHVEVTVETCEARDLGAWGQHLKSELESHYYFLRDILWSESYKELEQVFIKLTPNHTEPTSHIDFEKHEITASSELNRPPQDFLDHGYYHDARLNPFIKDLVSLIQQNKNCPSWVIDGQAGALESSVTGRILPKPYNFGGEHYRTNVNAASHFLKWLETNTYQLQKPLHQWISEACREGGNWDENNFAQEVGKTFDEFWTEMVHSDSMNTGFHARVNGTDDPESDYRLQELQSSLEMWYHDVRYFLDSPAFEPLEFINVYVTPGPVEFSTGLKEIHGGLDKLHPPMDSEGMYLPQNPIDNFKEWHAALITIMQQYRGGPEWLQHGIRDLALYRHEYNLDIEVSHLDDQHYTTNPYMALVFLRWIDRKFESYHQEHVTDPNEYVPEGHRVSYWLNRAMRDGTYSDQEFVTRTGKTVEELWHQMINGQKCTFNFDMY